MNSLAAGDCIGIGTSADIGPTTDEIARATRTGSSRR
jgi:hypothetical protein